MIKLGSNATETATGLEGMVTHMQIEQGGETFYLFQPRGLNPETGAPVEKMWVVESRLSGVEKTATPKLPTGVLGTEAEDMASGFKGKVTSICLHISGCVHVSVQPPGKLAKTGAPVQSCDFDIRRLRGPAIPVLTEDEREADQQRKPSPGEVTRYQPRPA